jgi:hypothetical protein
MNNWKSSLLDKLNVGSVTSSERGPGGLVKGMILAATVAVGVGAMSPNAYGDEIKKPEPTGFAKIWKSVVHVDDLILDPLREKAFGAVFSEERLEAAQANAEYIDNSPISTGIHTLGLATTALAAAAAAPAMGAWMIVKQADDTYEFIQDKQYENVNLKMAEVSERTQSIYDAEVAKIRDADPAYQQMLADRQAMDDQYTAAVAEYEGSRSESDLEQTSAIAASADLPTSTANLDALFPKEKAVEHDRSSELSR